MRPIVLIPARMASNRLPNKPLADIHGAPMIVHVLRRAMEAGVGEVAVACAEAEIAEAVEKAGGRAVLTDPNHPSGSDRIFEALGILDPESAYDTVINLQGDLPALDPWSIRDVLRPLENPNVDIATLVTPISDPAEVSRPSVVKAVLSFQDRNADTTIAQALYFSRAAVPHGEGVYYHHIGIYAYRREALARFVSLPPSPLEQREKLEQLRALEAGMRIDAAVVGAMPLGVDTPEDLELARLLLKGTA